MKGYRQLCVIKIDFTLYCYDTENKIQDSIPQKYKKGIKFVDTHQYKTCVITLSGKMKCFSYNVKP